MKLESEWKKKEFSQKDEIIFGLFWLTPKKRILSFFSKTKKATSNEQINNVENLSNCCSQSNDGILLKCKFFLVMYLLDRIDG